MTKSTDGSRGPEARTGQAGTGNSSVNSSANSGHLGGVAAGQSSGGNGASLGKGATAAPRGAPYVSGPTTRSIDRKEPVVIKKYANRRLYNTETSTYVTLDDLATMVRNERDFLVYDAKTGDDLTHAVLTQIIVEQESRMEGGQTMLPIPFLRQLIRFYGGSIERMVPSYLQFSLEALVKEQERLRSQFSTVFTPNGALEVYQDHARRNLAVFEQAMAMFKPFNTGALGGFNGQPGAPVPVTADRERAQAAMAMRPTAEPVRTAEVNEPSGKDMAEMKAQLADMQSMIEKLSKRRK